MLCPGPDLLLPRRKVMAVAQVPPLLMGCSFSYCKNVARFYTEAVGVSRGLGPMTRTGLPLPQTCCRRGQSPLSFLCPHTPLGLCCGGKWHPGAGPGDELQVLFHFIFGRNPPRAASLAARAAGSRATVPCPWSPALAWAMSAAQRSQRVRGETSAVFPLFFSPLLMPQELNTP